MIDKVITVTGTSYIASWPIRAQSEWDGKSQVLNL